MSPSKAHPGTPRGFIIPIGGAEKKLRDPEILSRFVEICGGESARIAIIPTASMLEDTGDRYAELFHQIGSRKARVLPFNTREDCNESDALGILGRADGVFMTGGNQLRLATTLGGTRVAKRLRARNQAGVHIAGTSAGAAFIAEHMIASGASGPTPKGGMAQLAPGLGLTNRLIIDQHFRQRDRLGRLLAALAYNPFAIGMGLDEDTAAFIGPDEVIEVAGSGGITLIDPTHLKHSSMDCVKRGEPVSLIDVRVHILVNGGIFDLETREARPAR